MPLIAGALFLFIEGEAMSQERLEGEKIVSNELPNLDAEIGIADDGVRITERIEALNAKKRALLKRMGEIKAEATKARNAGKIPALFREVREISKQWQELDAQFRYLASIAEKVERRANIAIERLGGDPKTGKLIKERKK